jgi:hypothetical protein
MKPTRIHRRQFDLTRHDRVEQIERRSLGPRGLRRVPRQRIIDQRSQGRVSRNAAAY